jgi:hypothetical protein
MKAAASLALLGLLALSHAGCSPDWATSNSSPFIIEVAGFDPSPLFSDVSADEALQVINDDVVVSVNAFRKNNNPDLGTSPVEHIYLKQYRVRFFRTDGRNAEGVDVPYSISGPLANLRFHTPGPGGDGEVELLVPITIVRQQAKLEPPLINLRTLGTSLIITMIAEVTVFAQTVQGENLQASGQLQVTFGNFPDE